MKANRRFEWNEGPDDELRALLREWKAPEPPQQMERALVRRLRQRKAWKRGAPWLAAAACVALVLLGRLTSSPTAPPPGESRVRDAAGEAAPSAATSSPPTLAHAPAGVTVPEASPVQPSESAAASLARPRPAAPRAHGAAAAARADDSVLVEPGQGELLARLARDLHGVRQSAPGAPPPPIEVITSHSTPPIESPADVELQPYQLRWESVGSEWPSMLRAF